MGWADPCIGPLLRLHLHTLHTQQVERAARELRGALRALVRAEGAGMPPGVAQREQLALLLQRQPGGGETGMMGAAAGGSGKRRGGGGSSSSSSSAASVVDAVGESREVTRSLARTRELMSQELRRMGGVVEVIGACSWMDVFDESMY